MFDLPHTPIDCSPAHIAGQNAFQVLLDCVAAAQESGDLAPGELMPLAWTAWSLWSTASPSWPIANLLVGHRATIEFTRRASRAMCGPPEAVPPPAPREPRPKRSRK